MMPRPLVLVSLLVSCAITPVSGSFYNLLDSRNCFYLDAILLLYGIIITALFVRERVVKRQDNDKSDKTEQDVRNARQGHKRGDDHMTYMPLKKQTEDPYREIEPRAEQRGRADQVYQGLTSRPKDTYEALHSKRPR